MWAAVAVAQVPDAGTVRQEVETGRPAAQPERPPPTAAEPAAERAPSGPTVKVTAFKFSGNTLLSSERLSGALSGYVGRVLDFAELQRAAGVVADEYREAGWIVRAYLPLQEIADGVVTIAVVEALFGDTKLEGDRPKRVPFERLSAHVDAQQAKGAPLDAAALDRALLLINDLPGVTATANLRAGEHDRETDLLLTARDQALLSGNVVVDNWGSRFTGEERATATFFLNSPFKRGDQMSLALLHSEGTNYVGAGASLPIGYDGWRIGVRGSYLDYELVADEFKLLEAQGSSTAYGVEASYPVLRSRLTNVLLTGGYEKTDFDNEVLSVDTSKYSVDAFTAAANAYRFDNLGGGGLTRAGLTVTYGKVDLSGSPNAAADAAGPQVDGGFVTVRYFLSREQELNSVAALYAALSGQAANGNLDSSEKFYLGGLSGVRAYQPSEAGGDEGQVINLEARFRLPYRMSATAFYDWGQVKVNRDNDFAGAAARNSFSVHGAGLALGWTSDFGLSAKATWAHRFSDRTDPGVDATLSEDRVLFQIGMTF